MSAEHVLRSLRESSGLRLASLDRDLAISEANVDFVAQFGLAQAATPGQDFLSLLHPGIRDAVKSRFRGLRDGRRQRFVEHVVGLRPGHVFVGVLTCMSVLDAEGDLAGFSVIVDVDESTEEDATVARTGPLLSPIHAHVLEAVAAGDSTVRISARLYLSRQGVEYHVGVLLKKFKVPNRAALVSRAYSQGLFRLGFWPPRVAPEFVR
ncbi:LuxR C-terminal-related transcriptional regulator [Lentzea sp. NPDC102401]|uniref:LuxR C-terminal-related transcriptional regulator n=1 Tax=Lentzea sp. NPDC102401 TaxID=3364128 RepID=UPI0038175425